MVKSDIMKYYSMEQFSTAVFGISYLKIIEYNVS